MSDQDKASQKEIERLDEGGSEDLEATANPKKEDPAEPRFFDWPKD